MNGLKLHAWISFGRKTLPGWKLQGVSEKGVEKSTGHRC